MRTDGNGRVYYDDDVETLKEKILQDFCDHKCKVENNICYIDYDSLQKIIDKRFGF